MGIQLSPEDLYHPIGGMNIDSNGISAKPRECIDAVNVDITSSEVVSRRGTRLLGVPGETQPEYDVIQYFEYVHPVNNVQLLAFTKRAIYRYEVGTGWLLIYDGAAWSIDMTFWSICDIVDRDIGATVVAAGSQYTNPTRSYVDGGNRVLLYYDPEAGTDGKGAFAVLQQKYALYGDYLTPAMVIPIAPAAHIVTGTIPTAPLVTGSVYFVVEDVGVVATAGAAETPVDATDPQEYTNRLVPVDDQVLYNENSFVNISNGEWSIEFANVDYQGKTMRVYYAYLDTVSYNPVLVNNFHNHLVMTNTYESFASQNRYTPWRTRWTLPNNIVETLQGDYQELAIDNIARVIQASSLETTASSTLVGPMYFYKHNSIIRATLNPNYAVNPNLPAPLFNLELAFSEGIEAINTLKALNGVHFYLGRNDVYMFNGYERISLTHDEQTGNTRVQTVLFDNLDLVNIHKCHAVYDELKRKYMLFVKKIATEQEWPTDCFVYDMDLNNWTRYTLPETSAGINIDLEYVGSIDQLKGIIDNLVGPIDGLSGNVDKVALLSMTKSSFYFASPGANDKVDGLQDVTLGVASVQNDGDEIGTAFGMSNVALPSTYWGLIEWYSTDGVTETHIATTADTPDVDGDYVLTDVEGTTYGGVLSADGSWYMNVQGTSLNEKTVFIRAYTSGLPVDHYFVTRDFYSESLEELDRTQRLHIEAKGTTMDVGYNGDYEIQDTAFKHVEQLGFTTKYRRETYFPDVVTMSIRFLIRLGSNTRFRWLQMFSKRQEFTGE